MTDEEYSAVQAQISVLGGIVRGMDLDGFIERARRASEVGCFFAKPQDWSRAHRRLDALARMAEKLRSFREADWELIELMAKEGDETAKQLIASRRT